MPRALVASVSGDATELAMRRLDVMASVVSIPNNSIVAWSAEAKMNPTPTFATAQHSPMELGRSDATETAPRNLQKWIAVESAEVRAFLER
mmetsp:Transcript_5968/g.19326  ORF Transcript_5968/g.19326 Transcript_5968/m.19326 type:complete len:91 (+) Transcript_5968:9985-10257(+)